MVLNSKIKITHVSYSVSKQTASFRLHKELIKNINSIIFVASKSLKLTSIIQPKSLFYIIVSKISLIRELLYSKIFPHNSKSFFSYNLGPVFLQLFWLNKLLKINTDIFHLHWIGNGFVNLNQFHKFKKPIVITLHDVWFISGGCHVNLDCKKYQTGCSNCPLFLESLSPFDVTNYIFNKKLNFFKSIKPEIIVHSSWMNEVVLSSPIFSHCNVHYIPNGLEIDVFKPVEKEVARNFFSIPDKVKIILFGGISAKSDFNKGYDLLMECFNLIENNNVELIVFGEKEKGQSFINGLKVTSVGYLSEDYSLALLYSAADLVVVPSRQESFSQVCLEAISCGTPAVAFDYSGPRDIIVHKENGYLARAYDPIDLAKGIDWILNNLSISNRLCINAREIAVRKFDIKNVANRHIELYEKILLN